MAVQSNVLTSALSTLSTSAGNAVSDLSSVSAGADVLASQFADVKVALQNLQSLATTMSGSGFYVPVGSLMPFAASAAPDGWLMCNGATWASLSLSAGSPLYDLLQPLGYLGVPDLRGRTIIGVGTGVDAIPVTGAINVAQGAGTVALTPAETAIRSHTHGMKNHTHTGGTTTNGNHQHTYSRAQTVSDARRGTSASAAFNDNADALTVAAGNHAHTFTTDAPNDNTTDGTTEVNGAVHTNVQPSLALYYIIKS